MKKIGFTLAETLVVLGVIGVVSLLTMPTFIVNQQKQIYAKTLQSAFVNFNTSMTNLISREGVDGLLETTTWQKLTSLDTGSSETDIKFFVANIGKVLSLLGYSTGLRSYKPLNDSAGAVNIGKPITLISKSGVEYKIQIESSVSRDSRIEDEKILMANFTFTNRAATVYIDVNGKNTPNILGRDLFRFDLATNGMLYPYGGADYCNYHKTKMLDFREKCVIDKEGDYCAAYLMNNGYRMDY